MTSIGVNDDVNKWKKSKYKKDTKTSKDIKRKMKRWR